MGTVLVSSWYNDARTKRHRLSEDVSGSFAVADGTSFAGTLQVLAGATLTLEGSATVQNLDLEGGTITADPEADDAALAIAGSFKWNGGTMQGLDATIQVGGSVTMGGATALNNGTLTTHADTIWLGGTMSSQRGIFDNEATFTSTGGGVWTAQGASSFQNGGTFEQDGPTTNLAVNFANVGPAKVNVDQNFASSAKSVGEFRLGQLPKSMV